MTALVGFDISTKEITAAIIPLDTDARLVDMLPFNFQAVPLSKTTDDGVRYLEIRRAVQRILGPSPYDIQLAYVERPWSRFAKSIAPMMGVYGAVMASIPSHITRAGIAPSEWRAELGLDQKLTKGAAMFHADDWLEQRLYETDSRQPFYQTTEHEADALLVALAARQLNNRHFRSAA